MDLVAASPSVRVVSLCSGIGALDLGVRLAVPGARTILYVEREITAVGVLASRIRDGRLDDAPVWADLSSLDARQWRGAVDLVVAGFPCQPVSIAGRRRGQDDDRWLWPDVCRVIAETEAPVAYLENVTGLLTKGADEVLDELAAMGLDTEWGCYSAAQAGAPHLRDRWFALAYTRRGAPLWLEQIAVAERSRAAELGQVRGDVANAADVGPARDEGTGRETERGPQHDRREVAYADGARLEGRRLRRRERANQRLPRQGGSAVANAHLLGLERQRSMRDAHANQALGDHADGRGDWPSPLWRAPWPPLPGDTDAWARWTGPQPAVRRGADGSARGMDLARTDRLRLLGNGVVPQQAAMAFLDLARRIP